jgi:hypothetical protein
LTSEPESHSHRTDQEWRAIIRGWLNDLNKATNHLEVWAVAEKMERIVDEH